MISSGGDGSEETITCTIGAYSWPGTIGVQSSVVEGRYCLTSAQLPTCGRLTLFLHIFLFLVHNFPSFSIEGIHKEIFVLTNTSVMVASHQIWKTKKGQVSPYTFFSLAEEAEMCLIVNHFNCLFQRRVVGTLVWKRMQSMQQYLYHLNTLCTG